LLLLFQICLQSLDLALVDQVLNVDPLLVRLAVRAVVSNLGAARLARAEAVEGSDLLLLVIIAVVVRDDSFLASFALLLHLMVDGEWADGIQKELGSCIIAVIATKLWLAAFLAVSIARRPQIDLLVLARPDALSDHFLCADQRLLLVDLRLTLRPRLLAFRSFAIG